MRITGCDLHARQQTIAMLDSDTGELEEKTLEHQGDTVRGVLFLTVRSDSGGDRSDRPDAVVPGNDERAGDRMCEEDLATPIQSYRPLRAPHQACRNLYPGESQQA